MCVYNADLLDPHQDFLLHASFQIDGAPCVHDAPGLQRPLGFHAVFLHSPLDHESNPQHFRAWKL